MDTHVFTQCPAVLVATGSPAATSVLPAARTAIGVATAAAARAAAATLPMIDQVRFMDDRLPLRPAVSAENFQD
jgi:hypothetical protein